MTSPQPPPGENLSSTPPCVLLFSGGRDSTIAALRLASAGRSLALTTVTSAHLVGIDAVRRRLTELQTHLPDSTEWIHVSQPEQLAVGSKLLAPTCLPCHLAYVTIGVELAKEVNAKTIAFGYAGYQSSWPEQTKEAVDTLHAILAEQGIELLLPVYDLHSKEEAMTLLSQHNINPAALEQKCTQQQRNITLPTVALQNEIANWGAALRAALNKSANQRLKIRTRASLRTLRENVNHEGI